MLANETKNMRLEVLKLVSNRLKPKCSITYANNSCKCCLIKNSSLIDHQNHNDINKRKKHINV